MQSCPRRTKGSVVWASCNVALLANSQLSVPSEAPWYLKELREVEAKAFSAEYDSSNGK